MSGLERLGEVEVLNAPCRIDEDCARYAVCLRANSCQCLAWGKCELLRNIGESCISNPQCSPGLFCKETTPNKSNKCMPITHLEDLLMFPDQPESNPNGLPDIAASYATSYLIAGISASLVFACVIYATRLRFSTPSADSCKDIEMTTPTSVLVNMNTSQQLPTYASTSELKAPHHQPVVLPS